MFGQQQSEDPILAAARLRAGAGQGGQPQAISGKFSDLIQSIKDWWSKPSDEEDPEAEAEARRQAVREAAARALPEGTGVPATLDAVERRRRLYQQVDTSGR